MPTILPVYDTVSWPTDEGVIGVVGVAPWATIDFLKSLYAQVNASKDWHYPRVLCDINTKLPSRGRHLELGERDPSPFIAATIAELAREGATLAVVPCNTAHILYDRWADSSPIPIPNIITEVTGILLNHRARHVAVLASRALCQCDMYANSLESAGMTVARLDVDAVELIGLAITEVKISAQISSSIIMRLERLIGQLAARGVDGLVLGCTELASLTPMARRHIRIVVESNTALARAALRMAAPATISDTFVP